MSYEQFRHSVVMRLEDIGLPSSVLNRVLSEIDIASQDYKIEHQCTDIISIEEGIPQMVKMFIASMAVKNCSRRTLKDYTQCLERFFAVVRKPYNMVTTNDIRLYLFGGSQSGRWCPATTDHQRTVINAFFNWCVDEEYLNRNPSRVISPIKVPKKKLKPLQQIELEEMRDACKTYRERALVDILFSSGVRISECVALTENDINWTDHTILVRHGKGDKERITYFNPEAEVSLRNYLNSRKGSDGHVFCKTRAPYTGVTIEALEAEIRHIRERIADKLGVKVTPHTLRRTTATIASERGMPIEDVQAILGHESIETTMRYVSVSNNRVKNNYSKYMQS